MDFNQLIAEAEAEEAAATQPRQRPGDLLDHAARLVVQAGPADPAENLPTLDDLTRAVAAVADQGTPGSVGAALERALRIHSSSAPEDLDPRRVLAAAVAVAAEPALYPSEVNTYTAEVSRQVRAASATTTKLTASAGTALNQKIDEAIDREIARHTAGLRKD